MLSLVHRPVLPYGLWRRLYTVASKYNWVGVGVWGTWGVPALLHRLGNRKPGDGLRPPRALPQLHRQARNLLQRI